MGIGILAVLFMPAGLLEADPTQLPDIADRVTPAWYLGMPVVMYSYFMRGDPGQWEWAADAPEMQVYLVAPFSDTAGYSPQRPGERSMPAHMTVVSHLCTPEQPAHGYGYLVIAGPEAGRRVRTATHNDNSLARGPLAEAMKIGTDWVPLDSHVVIEFGVEMGWLALQPLGAGTLLWGTLDWDDYRPMAIQSNCELEL